jgi:hypothetical protein
VLRRPTVAGAGLAALLLGVALLVYIGFINRGDSDPTPDISVRLTTDGVVLRWDNPDGSKVFGPLTYDVVVHTPAGATQASYLHTRDDERWPGCCRLEIPPGGAITKDLPRQKAPIGSIDLVEQHVGRGEEGYDLPDVTCRLEPEPECAEK